MDRKLTKPVLIFLSILLSISNSFSAALQYQTLVLKDLSPLTQTQTFSRATHPETVPESDNTLSLELIHRDNLPQPAALQLTQQALFNLRLRRDRRRFDVLAAALKNHRLHRRSFNSSVFSGVAQGSGEYFTRLGIGTPPRYVDMVLDTGSDVVWLQCAPCKKCYAQTDPVFDPRRSNSFSPLPCDSKLCRLLDSPGCGKLGNRSSCTYQESFGDGSFTVGEFSTETLTFRRNTVKKIALGCGHDNEGLFAGAAGILGLGRGKLSFPVQASRLFGGKFSYCLVGRGSPNKSSILFGESAASRKAVYTRLLRNPTIDTFYYVGLNGISVGGHRVPGINSSVFKIQKDGGGGVILDVGTVVTRLPKSAYVALRKAFRAGASNLKRAPRFFLLDTCYDFSGKTEMEVPTVALHFDGADMFLPARNYLVPVDGKGTVCFAFAGMKGGLSIIGNIQQQGFRVVYDLADNRVGFAARNCE